MKSENIETLCGELMSVLRMWGIGGMDSELSPFQKVAVHVKDAKNSYVEQLLKEINIAISIADDIFRDFGPASSFWFENPRQMRSLLTPLRDALVTIRDQRYQRRMRGKEND